MNKIEAIHSIEKLYPTDSPFPDTNKVGQELLFESLQEIGFDWRDLPEAVLVRYAEKCIERDNDCIRRFNEKYHGK